MAEIRDLAQGLGAKVLIVNDELTPVQIRNLEHITKLQVELARLEYELPRLHPFENSLDQQRGNGGAAGGGDLLYSAEDPASIKALAGLITRGARWLANGIRTTGGTWWRGCRRRIRSGLGGMLLPLTRMRSACACGIVREVS